MKETPLLMIAEMVNATLRIENPKTQTRRLNGLKEINKDPDSWKFLHLLNKDDGLQAVFSNEAIQQFLWIKSPYGQPGDQIWIREAVIGEELENGTDGVRYPADKTFIEIEDNPAAAIKWLKIHTYRGHSGNIIGPKVPPIHMPRWASRIQLEITSIRVERLQDISEADAIAEGLKALTKDGGLTTKYGIPDHDGLPGSDDIGWQWHQWRFSPVDAYRQLWESINGTGSWAANPWLWVVEFRRIKP